MLGDSIPLFYAVSFLPYTFYRSMTGQIDGAIGANIALLNFPRVNAYDTIVAEFSVQFLTNYVSFVIIMAGVFIIIGEKPHLDVPNIVIPVTLAMLLGLGVGMINAVVFALFPTWKRIWGVAMRPLLLASCVLHLPSALPQPLRDTFMLNPVADLVDWTRVGFYPSYTAPYALRFYAAEWAFTTCFVGLLMLRLFRRSVLEK
jgi:capsular polysaccharide transport system permease protein